MALTRPNSRMIKTNTSGNQTQVDLNSELAEIDSGYGYARYKNYIINGNQAVDQRNAGAAVNVTLTRVFVTDRFSINTSTTPSGTLTAQQVAGDNNSRYALRIARTAGSYVGNIAFYYCFESNDIIPLSGKTVTLSFRVRKGSTSNNANPLNVVVSFGTGIDQGTTSMGAGTWTGYTQVQPSSSISVGSLTTTFQKVSYTFTVPSGTTEFGFLVANQGYTGTGSANDYIDYTDFQLEEGSVSTAYEQKRFADQLLECQRYYEVTDFNVNGFNTASATKSVTTQFSVTKRVAPTANGIIKDGASNVGKIGTLDTAGTLTNNVTPTGINWSTSRVQIYINASTAAGMTANIYADAEL